MPLGTPPFESWQQQLAEMLCHATNATLPFAGSTFSLREMIDERCYREHEFTYKAVSAMHPEFELKPGYVKGIIDLIFELEGKFFIVDWKSNWLGLSDQFYLQGDLHKAMLAHDYFLQAHIYREALRRYLALIDERPFDELFGGVFYLFLRGLKSGTSCGCFHLNG
jgi:exodeoxyribonuclease V beta subunit